MSFHLFRTLLLLLPFGASAATLTLVSPEEELIGPAAAERNIRIHVVDTDNSLPGNELRGLLRGYKDDGTLSTEVVGVFSAPVSSLDAEGGAAGSDAHGQRGGVLRLSLPYDGLYELDIRLYDGNGAQTGGYITTLAGIPNDLIQNPLDWGVCTHFSHGKGSLPESLNLVNLAGFSRVRDEVYWNHVEQNPGVFEFPEYADKWIQTAEELGLSPLVVLSYGNASTYPQEFAGSDGFPENEASRNLFNRYVHEVVSRYHTIVSDWEVWNEPHTWGKASPETYTPLLKGVYQTIKAVDPAATVISSGGGGAGGGPGGDYITGIIRNGGLDYQDAFSIHPYMSPYGPEHGYGARGAPIPRVNIPAVWNHLGNFVKRNLRSDKKQLDVWTTEIGWPSHLKGYAVSGEIVQAAFISRTFLLARRYPEMTAVFIYDFQDDGNNPLNQEHNFGLITTEYAPKASYVSVATLARVLGNRPWVRSLVENDSVQVHQYGELSDGVIAAWTIGFERENTTISVPPGDYILRNWQGQDKAVTVNNSGDLQMEISAMPTYLLPRK